MDDTVDFNIAVKRLLWGKTANGGQTCLAPNHLFVTEKVKNKILPLIKKTLLEFYGENAQNSKDFMRRVKNTFDQSIGNILYQGGEFDQDDLFIPPIVTEVEYDDILLEEELFAPILPIITVDNIEDAIELIKQKDKPLGAYIFSNDNKLIKKFVEQIECGNICINDVMFNFAIDTLPFGGVGKSGFGKYRGKYGFDAFSNLKSVLHKGYFADWAASCRYPPLTSSKESIMKLFARHVSYPSWIGRWFKNSALVVFGFALAFVFNNYKKTLFLKQN